MPHERFRLLREHDPVHWHPWSWSGGGFWAITKYADVVAVSKDSETFSSAKGHIYLWELDDEALEVRRSLIETDGPGSQPPASHRQLGLHAAQGQGVRGAYTRTIAR